MMKIRFDGDDHDEDFIGNIRTTLCPKTFYSLLILNEWVGGKVINTHMELLEPMRK